MDYASTIYSSAKPYILDKLDPIHNMAIRLSSGAFRSSPIPSILAQSGEIPLRLHREKLMIRTYLRSQQNPNSIMAEIMKLDPLNQH